MVKAHQPTVAAIVTPTVVAAMGMSSSVLGDGTDSDLYISQPLHAPHLYWDCHADGPDPTSALPIHALIDDACTTVMIRPDLADALELRRVALHKPLEVGLAMDSGKVSFENRSVLNCILLMVAGRQRLYKRLWHPVCVQN
jgi:hypothetical protein